MTKKDLKRYLISIASIYFIVIVVVHFFYSYNYIKDEALAGFYGAFTGLMGTFIVYLFSRYQNEKQDINIKKRAISVLYYEIKQLYNMASRYSQMDNFYKSEKYDKKILTFNFEINRAYYTSILFLHEELNESEILFLKRVYNKLDNTKTIRENCNYYVINKDKRYEIEINELKEIIKNIFSDLLSSRLFLILTKLGVFLNLEQEKSNINFYPDDLIEEDKIEEITLGVICDNEWFFYVKDNILKEKNIKTVFQNVGNLNEMPELIGNYSYIKKRVKIIGTLYILELKKDEDLLYDNLYIAQDYLLRFEELGSILHKKLIEYKIK